jgi:hypothetical protein
MRAAHEAQVMPPMSSATIRSPVVGIVLMPRALLSRPP